MKELRISIVICTHNPTETFQHTMKSVDVLAGRDDTEVLVIENVCNAETKTEIQTLLKDRPWIRLIEEPRLGLSIARNRGIQEAKAPIIGFIDDDAEISATWVDTMLDAFARHPKAGSIGGKVELRYVLPPPAWITEMHRLYLGAFNMGTEEKILSFPDCPRGSNMAFRIDALQSVRGFSPHLGKVGDSLACFEEIDVCHRLSQAGWINMYEPTAVVLHWIEPFRYKQDWFTKRAFAQGRDVRIFERLQGRFMPALKEIRHVRSKNPLGRAYGRGYLTGCVLPLW